MKPRTRNRRPGFSRRAQYGLFFSYVVAVAGIVIGLGLILVAHFDPVGFGAIRGLALDLTTPVSTAGRSLVDGIGGGVQTVSAYINAGSQNAAMRAELDHDRQALVRARILALENARLRRLLRLVEGNVDPVAVARIVGSTGTSSRRLATLNAGSLNGVRPGQPVRSPEGLVGRVVETGLTAARVLLITDNASVVPVRLARGGLAALAAGRGDGSLELRPLGAGSNPFHRGDIVLTSGTGGLYPPDVPVAVVLRRDGDIAIAWPLADPARLDYAVVEPPYIGVPAPAAIPTVTP
ncbi:rod shape-determining protein MreC [Sphingomonas morindae]|uniref:Cell shape-determining protein MreC n=1 Tax=Sphingomonas morindae TaxID=1541170 RepID=A0ABY4X6S7_9SPHN|nr:rod shape-determining protein MreC [Sphingomonas morindae]USI72601.1 rod shape-determining protein MreC [Sphingomonas morindae]